MSNDAKQDLIDQFQKALSELDPTARVLVMEVQPFCEVSGRPYDPVQLSESQRRRISSRSLSIHRCSPANPEP